MVKTKVKASKNYIDAFKAQLLQSLNNEPEKLPHNVIVDEFTPVLEAFRKNMESKDFATIPTQKELVDALKGLPEYSALEDIFLQNADLGVSVDVAECNALDAALVARVRKSYSEAKATYTGVGLDTPVSWGTKACNELKQVIHKCANNTEEDLYSDARQALKKWAGELSPKSQDEPVTINSLIAPLSANRAASFFARQLLQIVLEVGVETSIGKDGQGGVLGQNVKDAPMASI